MEKVFCLLTYTKLFESHFHFLTNLRNEYKAIVKKNNFVLNSIYYYKAKDTQVSYTFPIIVE